MNRKERTMAVCIVASLLLVGLKYGLVALSGSLALRVSAWHSLVDVCVAVLVLGSLLLSRWETWQRHRQAHLIENSVALIVSGVIFYVAYGFFRDVLAASEQPDLRYLWPTTVAALLTILIAYCTARYKAYIGRASNSPGLIASGYHSHLDLYASVLVVLGLAGTALGLGALDRLAATVVMICVILAGWQIASSALQALQRGVVSRSDAAGMVDVRQHTALWVCLAAGLCLLLLLFSGIYTLQPGERGVVRRFGRVVADVGPGLHYRLPLVEQLDRVAVDQVRQVQTGQALVLTGDTNLIEINLRIHYHVTDAAAFLFNVQDLERLVAWTAAAVIYQVVAERGVDELLTAGRNAILAQSLAQTRALLDAHHAGIRVTDVQLLQVIPPPTVAAAFRDVASAREDTNTFINEALAFRNEVVPVARGEAAQTIQAAQAEKQRKIDVATGEAERFLKQLHAYRDAPQITRTRLYLEALERVLPAVHKFILDPSIRTDTTDLWFTNGQRRSRPSAQQTESSR